MPNLIINPPIVTEGTPAPTVTMSLTRNGANVISEVVDNRIINAAPGDYQAVWTATNTAGTATITRTATVAPATVAPTFTGTSSYTGGTTVGDTLTVVLGTVAGTPTPTISYQWRMDGVNVAGATNATFVRPSTVGGVPSVVITLSNGTLPNATRTITAEATTAAVITYIQNGTFDTDLAGWTIYAPRRDYSSTPQNNALATRTSGGRMRITVGADAIYPVAQTNLTNLVVGRTYRITATEYGSHNFRMTVYNTGGALPSGIVARLNNIWQNDARTLDFVATQTTHVFELFVSSEVAGDWGEFDNISVQDITAANVAPSFSTTSTITGNAAAGSTLTAVPASYTGNPAPTVSYQWRLDGVNVAGATNATYVRPSTIGAVPSVIITLSNGTSPNATQTITAAATVTSNVAPAFTGTPTITGATTEGATLTANPSTFTGNPTPTVSYQWRLNGTNVSGATSSTYVRPTGAGGVPSVVITLSNGTSPNATQTITAAATTVAQTSTLKANTLTNPPMSARLGVLDSFSSRVFVNHFKQSFPWVGDSNNASMDSMIAAGHMTPGGQLISIPPNSNGFRTRFFYNMPASTGATGRWRLRWQGTATIDIYGVSSVNRDVPNEITFNFTANGSSWSDMVVRTINSSGGQVRNFSLVHESDWADHAAGEIFRKQYLDEVRNYRALRFDEWIGILRSENEGGLRITNWASRPLPTDEIFYRFVSYEDMAALCNKVGADMWVCLPTAATDDHMQQAATLIRNLVPAPRHVYVEYSTKTWDFAGTPQAHYCAERGRVAFGTTANPTGSEFRNWYGLRATQMGQIWRGVWGNDSRLHIVAQHQADWVNGEDDILVAPMWQSRSGQNGLPTYVAPHTVFDMLTVHSQIDGGMAYGGRVTEIDNWRTTLSQTDAFNRMRNQMTSGTYWTADRTINNMVAKWNHFKSKCNQYGLEFGSYEIGNHLNGVGGSSATVAFIQAFSVSSQMGEVYTSTINAIRNAGMDGPLAISVEVRLPDQNVCHGIQRYLGDYNPAWAAVNAINTLNDGPGGRGANDFIGPYDSETGTAPTGPTETVPAQFATTGWSVATGSSPATVTLTISTLPDNGGSAITALQYSLNGTTWTALTGTGTGARTLTMAANATSYTFRVRAVNAVGNGPESATKTATSGAAANTAPAQFATTGWSVATGSSPATVTMNITALPSNGGSAITALQYSINNGTSWTNLSGTGTGSRTLTMAANSTSYTFLIRAVNAVGNGTSSATKTATSGAAASSTTSLRTPNTASDLKVHSGHSLTDTYVNEGETWPGFLPELFYRRFGSAAWTFEGTDYKDTIPGSQMMARWNSTGDNRNARYGISRYKSMIITERVPPFKIMNNTAEYITETLIYAMNFAANAHLNGNNGNGAESILWSGWAPISGNGAELGGWWNTMSGFRNITVEYGRTFRYIADYVTWKMKQLYPSLPSTYRMWLFPGHQWMVRVFDDIQAGLVPGITNINQLFRDDIHPNNTCSYALSVFMHTMMYQNDARTLNYKPSTVSTALDTYFKTVAWDIANTEESVGMGGTQNASPVWIPSYGDPMPNYSFNG